MYLAIVFVLMLSSIQIGYSMNTPILDPAWYGEGSHFSLNAGFGHEFSFTDYAEPFFNSIPVGLVISSSLTQQYSLYSSRRKINPLRIGKNNIYKYLEYGFGINLFHRDLHGSGEQQTQVINRIDSSLRTVKAVREVDASNLSMGVGAYIDMPTYIIDKLRLRLELNVNSIIKDYSRASITLSDIDTSVLLPIISNTTYSDNRRQAIRESVGGKTFGMVYSLKFGISYSIYILLREISWISQPKQYGELQPYINYTLISAPTISTSNRIITGFQLGVRFTIPLEVTLPAEPDADHAATS